METRIEYLGGVQFSVEARGHRIICDQPADNGGADGGLSQPELFLGSLGACAGHYALQYLKSRNLAVEGLSVHVTAEKLLKPARLDRFKIDVTAGGLTEAHQEGLLRSVKTCLIHNTLLQPVSIECSVVVPVTA